MLPYVIQASSPGGSILLKAMGWHCSYCSPLLPLRKFINQVKFFGRFSAKFQTELRNSAIILQIVGNWTSPLTSAVVSHFWHSLLPTLNLKPPQFPWDVLFLTSPTYGAILFNLPEVTKLSGFISNRIRLEGEKQTKTCSWLHHLLPIWGVSSKWMKGQRKNLVSSHLIYQGTSSWSFVQNVGGIDGLQQPISVKPPCSCTGWSSVLVSAGWGVTCSLRQPKAWAQAAFQHSLHRGRPVGGSSTRTPEPYELTVICKSLEQHRRGRDFQKHLGLFGTRSHWLSTAISSATCRRCTEVKQVQRLGRHSACSWLP